ncbi:MAG: FAD-dependent oxidoreductase [Bacillota bacterium]|nr:FAD-dependent oxidoreductase [Bacillota bacterium]
MNQFSSKKRQKIILVGGGHAHIHLMCNARRYQQYADITVISPEPSQLYSGMASGYIEGVYRSDEISFDLAAICHRHKITWIQSCVNRIDAENKKVYTSHDQSFEYDVLSVNTGSESGTSYVVNGSQMIIPSKPLNNLNQLKDQLSNNLPNRCKITVIGGGAAGIELSLAVRAAAVKMQMNPDIKIFERNADILPGYSSQTRKHSHKKLQQAGISLTCNFDPLERRTKDKTDDDKLANQDLLIWAAGSRAGSLFVNSQLPVDSQGFLSVNEYLQSTAHPDIFGAGDCISLRDYPKLRKVGVYAIRQSPVLCDNIDCLLSNKPLRKFKPQVHFLSILNTADKTGVLQWRSLAFSGRLPWLIKDAIDRRFMKRYQ